MSQNVSSRALAIGRALGAIAGAAPMAAQAA
jgi:hypothetical protein